MPRGQAHTRYLARVHDDLLRSSGLHYKPNVRLADLERAKGLLSPRSLTEVTARYLEFSGACSRQLSLADEEAACVMH